MSTNATPFLTLLFESLLVARARAAWARRRGCRSDQRRHGAECFHWQAMFTEAGGPDALTTVDRRVAASRARESLTIDRRLGRCQCGFCKGDLT